MRRKLVTFLTLIIILSTGCSAFEDPLTPKSYSSYTTYFQSTIAIVTDDPHFGVLSINRNGEMLALMTNKNQQGEIIEVIGVIWKSRDGDTVVMYLNATGTPSRVETKNYTISLFNYTSRTVDMKITAPDGTKKTYDNMPLDAKKLQRLRNIGAILQSDHSTHLARLVLAESTLTTTEALEIASIALGIFSCAATIATGGTLSVVLGVTCASTLIGVWSSSRAEMYPIIEGTGLGGKAIACGVGLGTGASMEVTECAELVIDIASSVLENSENGGEKASPELKKGSEQTSPEPEKAKDSSILVGIPAGKFTMGCSSSQFSSQCFDASQPAHTVYLGAYQIHKYEVTNAQYARCVKKGACTLPYDSSSETRHSYYYNAKYADYPVIHVDWYQAKAYCEWAGGRLPTEAEWEKAARGNKDQRAYPWGNSKPTCKLSNYGGCVLDTNKVGSYPKGASPYGVMDMIGNVFEWTADYYRKDYYENSPSNNPKGPSSGQGRVIRGCAFHCLDNNLALTLRLGAAKDSDFTGFRCVFPSAK